MKLTLHFGEYDCWMFYEPDGLRSFVLGVDLSLLEAPRRALEGGFAHELVHIVRDRHHSAWQLERAFARYRESKAWRTREERATDADVVRRGHGRELLALMLYARARGYTSDREHGLLLHEVRRRL